MAFTRPVLFLSLSGELGYANNNQSENNFHSKNSNNKKYLKSGLTFDYSLELKENLLHLLNDKKIFKMDNLTLEVLSNELDTNRHNASQVINEHFNMNFFELINQYRIIEAKLILEDDLRQSMNIIDVAYEVGYNNKVTFNKSFKKETMLTPSQYRTLHKRKLILDSKEALDSFTNENTNLFSGSGAA